jgi:hypothetical protein
VIESELEVAIDGHTYIACPRIGAIVPDVRRSVKALTGGRTISIDYRVRPD